MNKYIYSVFGFLLLFGQQVLGQESMSLEKAMAIALENNYQIRIDEANIRVADNNNTWARAGRYPTLDLNGSFQATFQNDNNPASFINGSSFLAGLGPSLDLQWLAYGGGRVGILKDQFDQLGAQQEVLRSINSQALLQSVVQAYYSVLLQQERGDVLKQVLTLSNDRLRYEEARKEFGAATSFSLLQFQDAALTDSINLVSQYQQEEIAKRNLFSLLLIDQESIYLFPDRLSVVPEEVDRDKMRSQLISENPTLRNLAALEELTKINTRLTESTRKPALSLGANMGFAENYFKLFEDNPNTGDPFKGILANRFNVGVTANFNWNLYDGGVLKSDVQGAQIQEEISALEMMQSEAELLNQLDILIANYDNQRDLLALTDKQISLALRNLEIAEERFKLGQITSFDYRTVQNQFLNAAFGRVNAIFNLINFKSEIDWLVGLYAD